MLTPTPYRLLCYLSSDTDDHPTRLPCPRRLHIACSAPCPPTPTITRRGYHAHADSTPLLRQHKARDEPDARAHHLHGLPPLGLVFDPPRWNPNTARATERARPRGPSPSAIIRTAREALHNLQWTAGMKIDPRVPNTLIRKDCSLVNFTNIFPVSTQGLDLSNSQ